MFGLKSILSIAAMSIGISGPAAARDLRVQPDRSVPAHAVLLLTNDNVLTGVIRREGDRYRVEQKSGVLLVPAGDVSRVATSIDALYVDLRAAIAPGGALGHLRLARWCLHQGLPGDAAHEILDAKRLEPHHPALVRLERELELHIGAAADPSRSQHASKRHRQPAGHSDRRRGLPAHDRPGSTRVARANRPVPAAIGAAARSTYPPATRRAVEATTRSVGVLRNRMTRVTTSRRPADKVPAHDPFDPALFNRRYGSAPLGGAVGHAPHDVSK